MQLKKLACFAVLLCVFKEQRLEKVGCVFWKTENRRLSKQLRSLDPKPNTVYERNVSECVISPQTSGRKTPGGYLLSDNLNWTG